MFKMNYVPVRTTEPGTMNRTALYKRMVLVVLLVGIYVWSAAGTHLDISELIKGLPQMADIISRMLPPNPAVLPSLVEPTIETLQISIWGTTLGIILTIPFGLLAARNISPHPLVYRFSRFILNCTRSISELIWALVFVAAVGLGPFPGVLALMFHSVGMLGKFLADSVENVDSGPVEALLATGAGKIQVLVYAIIPQILPEFITLSLYRWEVNFRSATILGIVGAGGIGFELVTSMRLFMYQDLTTILIVILVMVTGVDSISSYIRMKIL